MRKGRILFGALVIALIAIVGVGRLDAQVAPITVNPLSTRSAFTDDVAMQFRIKLDHGGTTVVNVRDPSLTVVAEILVQPGAVFPWHEHEGPVIVNVTAGELVYVEAEDCVEHSYPAGTVFVDPGNSTHTAFNPTSGVTRLVATYFDVSPAPGPLTITEGVTPGDCPINP